MHRFNYYVSIFSCCIGLVDVAYAQNRDPGTTILEEQLERERLEQLQRNQAGQQITAPKPKGPIEEVLCFPIDELEVKGITLFKPTIIEPIRQEFSNKCLGQASIGILIQRISGLYAEKGYITTRAYVPAQDISSRKLTIEVIEGRIEAFVYQQIDRDGKPKAGKTRKIKGAFPIKAGDIFQLRDVEHGLEQMNRLASTQANANLSAGQAPGTSQVVVTEQKVDTVRATLGFDNRGSEDTGETQIRLGFEVDDLLNLNDTYSFFYSGAENSNAIGFSASIPFRKWLFSANGSYSESLSAVTAASDLFTQTINGSVRVERLLFRDAQSKYFAYGAASIFSNERFINITALQPQKRSALSFGFRNEHRMEKFVLSADTSFTYGAKFLGADFDPPVTVPGASRADFEKIETRLTYIRPLKEGRQFISTFVGQLSSAPLFSNEQISIGGWESVRGYNNFSFSGDAGFYSRNEFSFSAGAIDFTKFGNLFETTKIWNPLKKAQGGYRPFVFADFGSVSARASQASVDMFGIGTGVSAQIGRLSLSGTIAMPLKDQNGQRSGKLQALLSITTKLF